MRKAPYGAPTNLRNLRQMSTHFIELKNAVRNYLATSVDVTIESEDVAEVGNPDGVNVNVGEPWSFKVTVRNKDWADMKEVTVRLTSLDDATVARHPDGPWLDTLVTNPMSILGGRTRKTRELYFKAPDTPGLIRFEASVEDWQAELVSIFERHSVGDDSPEVKFSTNVTALPD